MDDPAHPYVSNAIAARTGKLPTFPSETSPIRFCSLGAGRAAQHNERVLAGKPGYTLQARCRPMGVPAFHLYPVRRSSSFSRRKKC